MLETSDLSFSFSGGKPILSSVSFTVDAGSLLVITGRNGSGKTMLMRIIKGLCQPTAGTITINGKDLTKSRPQRNRAMGLVFQDTDTQLVGQTVERDILFGLENLGINENEQTARMEQIASTLQLQALLSRRPRTLSGGERRRLAIAGVLVMRPLVLALDEPFANLDYPGVVQVLESLTILKEQGQTIIVITHELEKILAHADSVLLLEHGAVVAQDEPDAILEIAEAYGVRRPRYYGTPLPAKELTWMK